MGLSNFIKTFLRRLSFRTGVIVTALCLPCYAISFLQMALPISYAAKATLWIIFFGLAKCFQYGGLTILGAEGWKRLKHMLRKKRIAKRQGSRYTSNHP